MVLFNDTATTKSYTYCHHLSLHDAHPISYRDNSVSVGSEGSERQITNVADGTEDTDAVNLAQLQEVAKTADNTDHFFKATDDPDNPGVGSYVEGINATAAGEAANATGAGASAYGRGADRKRTRLHSSH